MLKAVIFDFGGVFTSSPVSNFAEYEDANGLPRRFIGHVIASREQEGAFSRFERGEITVDSFDELFASETREAGHEITGRALIDMMQMTFRPDMIAALDAVRAGGFLTGCITNNMPKGAATDWARNDADRAMVAEIMGKFTHVIESAAAGVRKPEPRIYEMMCEALGVTPQEAAFLDDLGVNLKPAKAMGMQTIKVPLDDYQQAIRELAGLTGLSL